MRDQQFVDLGLINFYAFLNAQNAFWERRVRGGAHDTVIFAEHPPTISLGTRPVETQLQHLRVLPEELRRRNIAVFQTRRGGSISLHAPGILGCYVVMKTGTSIVPALEQLAQEIFFEFGLQTGPVMPAPLHDVARYRGAWIHNRKIASIGVGVSRNVTRFGMCVNVSADPELLRIIHPCGIEDRELTTMALEGVSARVSEIKDVIRESLPHIL